MATNPVQSDVFKFVALRPPDAVNRERGKINFIADDRKPENTSAGELAKSLLALEDVTQISSKIKGLVHTP